METVELNITDFMEISKSNDVTSRLALIRTLISRGIQLPYTILSRGAEILANKGGSMGDEKWTLMERVLLAAIKLDVEPWVGYCLSTLRNQFPNSERVERLSALYRESKEDWVEAESIYTSMLRKAPENMYARKRLIACLKAQGRLKDAISSIIDQLDVFSADTELWHELSMLYMGQCSYTKAASAFEEVLLADPKSFYNLLVYAEMEFSAGEVDLARKYYCKALEYRSNEPRALWGLVTCLQEQSLLSKKLDAKEGKIIAQLKAETKKRLEMIYSSVNTESAKLCLKMLRRIE
jgi:tetratricopeptide (TPR) repeat protein